MSKGPRLQEIWDELSESRKNEIEATAVKLEAEYMTLQEVRKSAGLTQEKVSDQLEMPQSNVSRLEKNSDMLLSTLREYVEAIGGTLKLTVELPNKPPIILEGLSDLIEGSE